MTESPSALPSASPTTASPSASPSAAPTGPSVWVDVEPLEVFTGADPSGWTCDYVYETCTGCGCGNGCCTEGTGCPFSASCGSWGAASIGMLGGYGRFGGGGGIGGTPSHAQKTFTGIATHTQLRVSFTFFKFDSWDNNEKVARHAVHPPPPCLCPADALRAVCRVACLSTAQSNGTKNSKTRRQTATSAEVAPKMARWW